MHRGGEWLSSCKAPRISDPFAAFAGLTFVRLPPHTGFPVSPSMSCRFIPHIKIMSAGGDQPQNEVQQADRKCFVSTAIELAGIPKAPGQGCAPTPHQRLTTAKKFRARSPSTPRGRAINFATVHRYVNGHPCRSCCSNTKSLTTSTVTFSSVFACLNFSFIREFLFTVR